MKQMSQSRKWVISVEETLDKLDRSYLREFSTSIIYTSLYVCIRLYKMYMCVLYQ